MFMLFVQRICDRKEDTGSRKKTNNNTRTKVILLSSNKNKEKRFGRFCTKLPK